MGFESIKDRWLKFVNSMNSKGVPVPLIRDPKSGLGSVSLTLTFISFNVWLASVIGKVAGVLGGMNPDQCLNMFLVCAGLYWGRKFQSDGKKISLGDKDVEAKE